MASTTTYTMSNTRKWGVEQEYWWDREYNGYKVRLVNEIGYKWVTIEIELTDEEKAELDGKEEITHEDIGHYPYTIVEVNEGSSDWAIVCNGDVPQEIRDALMEEFEENDCDVE